MGLPDRTELCRRFDAAIGAARGRDPSVLQHGRDADARPAVCVVAVDDLGTLVAQDRVGADAALDELGRRLDHLVRSGDLLGRLGPGELALATASLAPSVAGSLVERIHGAAAMPLRIAGRDLSLGVTVGVAFAGPDDTASAIIGRAEAEVVRARARR